MPHEASNGTLHFLCFVGSGFASGNLQRLIGINWNLSDIEMNPVRQNGDAEKS
jgi:hypothetical protein